MGSKLHAPHGLGAVARSAWWSHSAETLLRELHTTPGGLSARAARARLAAHGPNTIGTARRVTSVRLLARQFASPLVLILAAGALISLGLRDWVDALTILAVIAMSAGLGFVQEWRASLALTGLQRRLALEARAWRDGQLQHVPAQHLVAGDVIELAAGHLVPADGIVLAAREFLVNQASLTGESLPVEKSPGIVAPEAPVSARTHCVFLGSSVRSGTARVLVVATGGGTALAEVAARLSVPETVTEFEHGVRRFGEMLLRVMLLVVIAVLMANQALGRPMMASLLFAVALAVGLSPELLPAIVSVSLARGARQLAAAGVLVRRLDAIEDLGSMDVLCTDKTGTLTVGTLALEATVDAAGRDAPQVLRWAYLNAAFETGIDNPIDAALDEAGTRAGLSTAGWAKVDEIPYDFARRRLTVVVAEDAAPGMHRLVTKGAVANVLDVCALDAIARTRLQAFVQQQGERGVRVLALATRTLPTRARYTVDDEQAMQFEGFLCFSDPPKPDAAAAVRALAERGIRVKIVSGDNRHVAAHLAAQVGLDGGAVIAGDALSRLRDEALWHVAERTDVFAEVDPAQKERIVRALQRTGHAVGYLGDGINDAPALHAADVGLSVDGAVDVARESADIVLLAPDLQVLRRGVEEGRRTFANTLKYIQITTSANFGNMVSMALATPLLPFLPLTATLILLNNFLSDLPSLAIAADRVDADALERAQRWDLTAVRRFMLLFGLLSSAFDLLTFALLRHVFDAGPALFHSAWFVVSLLTELVVVIVLRTRGPCWRSRPAPLLGAATCGVALLTLALPYASPLAGPLGLVPLPAPLLGVLLLVVVAYLGATEAAKRRFFAPLPKA